jgi:predicted ribosomally synthesized peptide with nif11-like leader
VSVFEVGGGEMSKDAFLRFREAVLQNGALQAELVDTVKSQADLLAMGKRLGFEFDAADLASPDLAEEELAKVAGGGATLATGGVSLAGTMKWAPVGAFEKWTDVRAFNTFVNRFPK